MSTVRDQIGKQAMDVMQDLQKRREAEDASGENLEQSPETDLDYCEQGPANLLHAKRSVHQFIRQLPIKSALIALGAGVLFGTFWTIRRR